MSAKMGRPEKYGFGSMQRGDRLFVRGKSSHTIYNILGHYKRTRGWDFKATTMRGGVMICRTK